MKIKQKTLRNKITLSGIGLHTGTSSEVTFNPAPVNHGIEFIRTDITNAPRIPAYVNYVSDTTRGTTLSKDGFSIHTVEHLLAAISGVEIDNLLIEVNGPEIPILDGSSREFVQTLKKGQILEQGEEKSFYEINEPLLYESDDDTATIKVIPSESFQVVVEIDYNSPVLGIQKAEMDQLGAFIEEIAPSRTFCFLHELEQLFQANKIKGGDLSNAIVISDRDVGKGELDHLASLLGKSTVPPQRAGILNNTTLRFSNEPARHKLLDLIGDLSLLGKPIRGKVIAKRPGHTSNIEFVKLIKEQLFDLVKEEI